MSETEPFAAVSEVLPSDPPALSEDGGTSPPSIPPKARSGFQRQKLKVKALERRVHELEDNHENLLTDYEGLLADHERLGRDYAKLESAFNEITQLNATLAGELRQLKSQQRPGPVRYGTTNLMGM
jgi:DNA repair exonuclease SbcCD ATPase subunit